MRIRAFPIPKMTLDGNYINEMLELFKKFIQDILHRENSSICFEEMYRIAYTMVLHKHADKLYNGLQEVVREHLQSTIRNEVLESFNGCFLETLNRLWTDYETSMIMIRDILMYLDRIYVQRANVVPLYILALSIFRTQIVDYPLINEHLKATMLGIISTERQKIFVEGIHLKKICQMLIELGSQDAVNPRIYYEHQFENLFLAETAEFYRRASQNFLAENNACIYVHKVNECLMDEMQRAHSYFDKITEGKVISVLNDELISKNMVAIVEMENSGIAYMLQNDRVQDLSCLYELLKRVPNGTKTMINAMSRFLCTKAITIANENTKLLQSIEDDDQNANVPNPINYIQCMIELKDQFDHFLTDAFNNDGDFVNCIQSTFENFLNLSSKEPKFLSLYIDDKLSTNKGVPKLNAKELENILDKAIGIFRFLHDKELFHEYYTQYLAKRLLLLGKSISHYADDEKLMIAKLKAECGFEYVSKIDGMLRDMELSDIIMNAYKEQESGQNEIDLSLSMRVLRTTNWPIGSQIPICVLPQSAEFAFRQFAQFYLSRHNGRKISLAPFLGDADLKAIFYKQPEECRNPNVINHNQSSGNDMPGPSSTIPTSTNKRGQQIIEEEKLLTVTTYQMCLLMRFNIHNKMTFQQIMDETQIPVKELKQCVKSLAMGENSQHIICRKGVGQDIEMNDEFWINDGFTSKLTQINVQIISRRSDFKPEHGDLCFQGGMQIFVKTLSSGTITIWVESTDTIWDVKIKLGEFSVSPWRQHLIFNGKNLNNDCTLANYNIQDESTLFLLYSR